MSHENLNNRPTQPPISKQRPPVFYVPRNAIQLLDFSASSDTPESRARAALLSTHLNQNAVALVGMGGVGKTTILRALGRDAAIWAKFPDGVWFLQLGNDATLRSLLDRFQELVTHAFPDFLQDFIRLAATESMREEMINQLIDYLEFKRFLILFDDVWDVDQDVYNVVNDICTAAQQLNGTFKVLTSTRSSEIARVPNHDVSVNVNPVNSESDTARRIFCRYANIEISRLPSLSTENKHAFHRIIETCAGLPLALSVAGSSVLGFLDPHTDISQQDIFIQYWTMLKKSSTELSREKSGKHNGLFAALQSSLEMLEKKWNYNEIQVSAMFRSLCILQKSMCLPLRIVEKLWGVSAKVALDGVQMFSQNSVLSLVRDDKNSIIVGLRVHDLVHDLSVEMAESEEGVTAWHKHLLDGYRNSSIQMNTTPAGLSVEWWSTDVIDEYIIDNVVRHLAEDRRGEEALRLLTDYRWIEKVNNDERRVAFQKIILDMNMLRSYFKNHEDTEMGRRVVHDINVVVKTMELCMLPYCMKNRRECTFQLHGRLTAVASDSSLVKRMLWSVEKYGSRPWVRAGPGVLTGAGGALKRVLEVGTDHSCMTVGMTGNELVVGHFSGDLSVISSRDGSKLCSLVGHRTGLVNVAVDRNSGKMYSCDWDGVVIVWKDNEELRCFQATKLGEEERVACMQVLWAKHHIVVGTDEGRLLVLDIASGKTVKAVHRHSHEVSSLASGYSGDVLVSGSDDHSIRVWKDGRFEQMPHSLVGHTLWVNCVALSEDEKLVASGSRDETVRLWDVSQCREVWKSSEAHRESVRCVSFSGNGGMLYSGDESGKICGWRVTNGGNEVTLMSTFRHDSMPYVRSLFVGDGDSELYALRGVAERHAYVWDTKSKGNEIEGEDIISDAFLPDVSTFGISADEATMVTYDEREECIHFREVRDVAERKDRTIARYQFPRSFFEIVDLLAVSNDQQFIAYAFYREWDIHVLDMRSRQETVLSDLSTWAHAYASLPRSIEKIYFNSDGTAVTAVASGKHSATKTIRNKISWHVWTGELLHGPLEGAESTESAESNLSPIPTTGERKNPRLFCKESFGCSQRTVQFDDGATSFTIATMENEPRITHYCFDTSRLWVSRASGGLEYLDLISTPNFLQPGTEPSLTIFPHPQPEGLPMRTEQHISQDGGSRQTYDVFISHAGPDKQTIAQPLFDALMALGMSVFFDNAKLRPGQHASAKMNDAMKTARIAVVILSPQFAARYWTTRELLCFVERFRLAGELGVIIIPVFYRLSLADCKTSSIVKLLSMADEDGKKIFEEEGFPQLLGYNPELISEILKALGQLCSITGIENKEGATNGEEDAEKRMRYVERIVAGVEEAKARLEGGGAAGASGA